MHTPNKSAGRTTQYGGRGKGRNFKRCVKRSLIFIYCLGLMPAVAVVWMFRALRLQEK